MESFLHLDPQQIEQIQEQKKNWWKRLIWALFSFLGSLLKTFLVVFIVSFAISKTIANDGGLFGDKFSKVEEFVYPEPSQEKWLEDSIFPDRVKDELDIWNNSKKLSSNFFGSEIGEDHLLLYGPPGTGKTYLAEMFAKNEALAYTRVNFATEFVVGSSKAKQDKIFQQAKKIIEEKQKETLCKVTKPVVIIIDEIDAVGRKTFSPISPNNNEATDNLLINIDKIRQEKLNIVIIATTNYSSVLDPALVRTGRFGYQIKFSYPTESEIDKMVERCQEKVSSRPNNIDWPDNYWLQIKEITQNIRKEVQNLGIGFTLLDIEKSLQYSWIKKMSSASKIIPNIADYRSELEKIIRSKVQIQNNQANFQPEPNLLGTIFHNLNDFVRTNSSNY